MPNNPCLHIVSIDPPRLECSECKESFPVTSDSLRAVLAEFREHVNGQHSRDQTQSKEKARKGL